LLDHMSTPHAKLPGMPIMSMAAGAYRLDGTPGAAGRTLYKRKQRPSPPWHCMCAPWSRRQG